MHAAGDGGTLTNKLVLTQGNPTGDVAFGVDNTFATRALDAGVFAPYDVTLPPAPSRYLLPGDDHRLAPIDNGNVCVNVDTAWFARAPPGAPALARRPGQAGVPRPARRARRHRPAPPGWPSCSARSAGTATGWPTYWQTLLANDALVTDGWSQAYETDFTQGGGHGDRPIVVSYDSSPAVHRAEGVEHLDHQGPARHLLPAGRVRRRARRRRERRRAPRRSSTSCSAAGGAAGAARVDVRLPGPQRAPRCPRPGRGSPSSPRTRSRSARPRSPPTATPGCASGATSSADDPTHPAGSSTARRRDRRRSPCWCWAIFFVLPVGGMVSRGFVQDGRLDVAGVLAVLGRPEIHRAIWFTLWSSLAGTSSPCCSACRPRTSCTGCDFPGRTWLRALLVVPFVLPTVVVGVAFELLIGEAGRSVGSVSTAAVAIVAGLAFFNASVVIRVVGGAWESLDPRPAEAAAALGASPWQVLRDVTFPALRPAIVSAATVVFLFCATAFGIVLTLGGLRYSSVETQIYLLTTHLLDLQAAAALSIAPAGRRRRPAARGGPARVVRRTARLGRSRVRLRRPCAGRPAGTARHRRLLAVLVVAPLAALVVESLRVDGAWCLANYRALQTPGSHQALLVPVTTALVNSLRIAVDATWMSLLLGLLVAIDRHPPLAQPRRAPAAWPARRALHAAARGLGGDRSASAS